MKVYILEVQVKFGERDEEAIGLISRAESSPFNMLSRLLHFIHSLSSAHELIHYHYYRTILAVFRLLAS